MPPHDDTIGNVPVCISLLFNIRTCVNVGVSKIANKNYLLFRALRPLSDHQATHALTTKKIEIYNLTTIFIAFYQRNFYVYWSSL